MKALFLVNERSGPGRRRKFNVSDLIRRVAECEYDIVPCGRKEDLDAVVDRAENEGFDVVYAVGGDGTVHETAKRLIGRRPALGILPIGSGNGLAHHLGLPMDPAESIRACSGSTITTIDTAEVNGRQFLNVMGVGFDAVVAHRFAASEIRGLRTYFAQGFAAYAGFHAEEYEITTDTETFRKRASLVEVANGAYYGNNARIAPPASIRDGMLDVVLVDDVSFFNALRLLPPLFRGTFHRSRFVTMIRTRALTIRRAEPGPVQLDGEPYTLEAELHVRVAPQSLKVLVPDGTMPV